LAKPVNTRT
jgi:phosphatidylinositol 4-phosphatase